MARIRTIKPEFPQSESIGALSRDARLLFIQLWTIVDDAGRSRAASRMLASLLYPYDDDAAGLIDGWLAELEQSGFVRRYIFEGSTYLEVSNWLKHQKIDHPSASRFPAYSPDLAKPREDSRSLAPDLGPRTSTKDQDIRAVAKATRLPLNEKFEEFKKAYPKRTGGNPWKPARELFERKVRAGTDPDQIIRALKEGVGFDPETVGTKYVPQAVRWLRDERFSDLPPPASPLQPADLPGFYAADGSAELDAWDAYWRRSRGVNAPRDRHFGYRFDTQWPPDDKMVGEGGLRLVAPVREFA
jgi:hypothetical protein